MPELVPANHYLNVGPGGTFKRSGSVQTTPQDVDAMLERIARQEPPRVAIHFHGGVVSEAKGLAVAARLNPVYHQAGAYPITVVWETGLVETITNNLKTVNNTELFNKIVNYAIQQAAKWLGASVGARGPGQPMSIAEIDAARRSDAEMEEMDALARGPGGVETEADVVAAEPEIEAELQLEIESDPDIARLLEEEGPDREAIDDKVLSEVDAQGQRGLGTALTIAKIVVRVVSRVLKRYVAKRDHGVIPSVVEEVLREAYGAKVGEWVWSGMKTAGGDMWKANAGPVDESSHAGTYLFEGLLRLQAKRPELKIDVIGHSAGSIPIAKMLEAAGQRYPGFRVRNVILLAPAANADVFQKGFIANQAHFDDFRMFTMQDELERSDHLVPGVYPRSLLYLVSGIFEGEADSPVVGMRRHTTGEPPYDVSPFIEVSHFLAQKDQRLVLSKTAVDAAQGLRSLAAGHGEFDNDPTTLASLTAIIAR